MYEGIVAQLCYNCVFCLKVVVGYLFIVMAEFFVYGSNCVFVLMVVTMFFVYGGGCVFCLMVVVGFLFIVVAEFFIYGSG